MNDTTIIIPTYNEAKNIEAIIEAIFSNVPEVKILVVDDNSPDGTADIVRGLVKKNANISLLFREKKEGLGKAYIHAFTHLLTFPNVRTVVMMDADFSHNPKYLPLFIKQSDVFDLLVGSRYILGGQTEGWEFWRRFLSRGANIYAGTITGLPVSDLTGGFNLIRTDLLRKIDFSQIDASGYAFQIELKYMLCKKGARCKELPILFTNRREGESKMNKHIIGEGILAPWKMILKK